MNIIERRKDILARVADEIKALGYDVYITTHPNYVFGYIVNGKNRISYFEVTDLFEVWFGSLHVPSRAHGSCFRVGTKEDALTKEFIDNTFLANTKEFPYAKVVSEKADEYLASCDRMKDLKKI